MVILTFHGALPSLAMAFRLNAKNIFLTYAQCTILKEDMIDYLRNLEGDRIAWMIVAHEKHADGGGLFNSLIYFCNHTLKYLKIIYTFKLSTKYGEISETLQTTLILRSSTLTLRLRVI